MDQPPVTSAPPKADLEAIAGDPDRGGITTTHVTLIPPSPPTVVVLFWGLAPYAVVEYPWTLVLVGVAIMAWIQGLEWFLERHEGWRLNKREFATDVFYVVLSYTAITWATSNLAEEPLLSIKESLGIATPWLK